MTIMIKKLKFLAILLIATLTFASCGDDEKNEVRYLTVKVASKLTTVGSGSTQKNCMDITVEANGQKLYLQPGEILGFNYVEGYEYRLKIKEMHEVDKDGNEIGVYYELDVILSEKKVDDDTPIGPIPS